MTVVRPQIPNNRSKQKQSPKRRGLGGSEAEEQHSRKRDKQTEQIQTLRVRGATEAGERHRGLGHTPAAGAHSPRVEFQGTSLLHSFV